MNLTVIALIASQEASNAAWNAWLSDLQMSWLQGVKL